jgi:uncharacterized protein
VLGSHRELVERAYGALNAGDIEGFKAFMDPEGEWHWPPNVADTDVYRGADEVARAIARWSESWADFQMHVEELVERGDSVFVVARYCGHGRTSGLPIDQTVAHVWDVSAGRVTRVRMFGDVEKARQRFLEA